MGTAGELAPSDKSARLQQQAEEAAQAHLINQNTSPLDEMQRRIHDLQARQAELERQNENLRYAQQQLEASVTKYAHFFESAPVGYFVLDQDGLILDVNLAGANLLGISKTDLLNQPLTLFIAPASQDDFSLHYVQVFKTKTNQTCDLRLVTEQGHQFGARLESVEFQVGAGNINQCQTIMRPISDEQTKKALAQRNRELELLNLAGQAFISTLNLDQVITTVLEGVRHLLGVVACSVWLVDPDTDELVCRQTTSSPQVKTLLGWRLAPGEGLAGWAIQHEKILNVPDIQADERGFKGIDEQTAEEIRSILTVPLWMKQKVVGVIQVLDGEVDRFDSTDIRLLNSLAATAAIAIENAKLYEQALQDAETKAMLLNEVNHRVRNNLGVIIGLLYLEQHSADVEENPVNQTVMQELANRVQGLATVHDLLSASEWAPLRLSDLAQQIIQACLHMFATHKDVSLTVSPSSVEVPANQAHSLALVINELTTNTVKYAWPEQKNGQIKVNITHDDETILFEFRDNGQGYPKDVLDLERHNIGFELIQNIVARGLNGGVSLSNDQGAITTIRFKADGQRQ